MKTLFELIVGDQVQFQNKVPGMSDWTDIELAGTVIGGSTHYLTVKNSNGYVARYRKDTGKSYVESHYRIVPHPTALPRTVKELVDEDADKPRAYVVLSYRQMRSMLIKARRLGTKADSRPFNLSHCFVIEGAAVCSPMSCDRLQMTSPTIRSVRSTEEEHL